MEICNNCHVASSVLVEMCRLCRKTQAASCCYMVRFFSSDGRYKAESVPKNHGFAFQYEASATITQKLTNNAKDYFYSNST